MGQMQMCFDGDGDAVVHESVKVAAKAVDVTVQLPVVSEGSAVVDARKVTDAGEFVGLAKSALRSLPDDICIDDVLRLLGFPEHSIVAWHRSRVIDALVGPGCEWTGYGAADGIRFKRKVGTVRIDS
jgi:hypothetical protein